MSPRRPPPPHAQLHLPSLDGHQALTLVNILDRFIAAIWRAHAPAMQAAMAEAHCTHGPSLDGSPAASDPSDRDSDHFPF